MNKIFFRRVLCRRFLSVEKETLATPAEQDLSELLKEKEAKITELQDMFRRSLADAENIRQRTRKELQEKETFAITRFAKDLLDTADILKMALDSVPKERGQDLENLFQGVTMTHAELLKTFKRYGVEPYNPIDEAFDPNWHQALFQAPIPDKKVGTIFQVTKIGYKIGDRVLRPAQVGVVRE